MIITISGAHSNIGKTSLAERLLCSLKGWSAIKVTVMRRSRCPRDNGCTVCDEFDTGFDLITDEDIIKRKDTDTSRLLRAGAKRVIWLKSTLKALKAGLDKALRQLDDSRGIIIEGTSAARYIKPDLLIFLDDRKGRLRQAAREARKRADVIVDASSI